MGRPLGSARSVHPTRRVRPPDAADAALPAVPEPRATPSPYEYVGEEMTLFEHLNELRSRLFKSAVGLAVGFAIGFAFIRPLLTFLIAPYCRLDPELRGLSSTVTDRCQLVFLDVLGAFFINLKVAGVIAVVIGGPIVAYQLWRFVTPGLRPVEKRWSVPFIISSGVLFTLGALFAYVILEQALRVLLAFSGDNLTSLMDGGRYLSFLLQIMVGFGIAFQMPLILITLVLAGTIGTDGLTKYRRHAIFATFVASAFITPTTDPFTLLLLALPLIGFYELSVLVAKIVGRRRRPASPT